MQSVFVPLRGRFNKDLFARDDYLGALDLVVSKRHAKISVIDKVLSDRVALDDFLNLKSILQDIYVDSLSSIPPLVKDQVHSLVFIGGGLDSVPALGSLRTSVVVGSLLLCLIWILFRGAMSTQKVTLILIH